MVLLVVFLAAISTIGSIELGRTHSFPRAFSGQASIAETWKRGHVGCTAVATLPLGSPHAQCVEESNTGPAIFANAWKRAMGCAAVTALLLGSPHAALSAQCVDESNPSYTIRHCKNIGVQPDGRLAKCSANSNCLSTSSVSSPQHFAVPWSFKSTVGPDDNISDRDVRVSWNLLVDRVSDTPGLTIAERDDSALYLRAEAPSSVPPTSIDDVEFVLRRDDGLVTFKSETRDTVFVYPVQRPLGCNDCHKKRLDDLRARLGWDELSDNYGAGSDDGGNGGGPEFTLGRFVPLF